MTISTSFLKTVNTLYPFLQENYSTDLKPHVLTALSILGFLRFLKCTVLSHLWVFTHVVPSAYKALPVLNALPYPASRPQHLPFSLPPPIQNPDLPFNHFFFWQAFLLHKPGLRACGEEDQTSFAVLTLPCNGLSSQRLSSTTI